GSDPASSTARGVLVPFPCAEPSRRFSPTLKSDSGGSGGNEGVCYRCEPRARLVGWPDDSSSSGGGGGGGDVDVNKARLGRRGDGERPRRDSRGRGRGGSGGGGGNGMAVKDMAVDGMAVGFSREKEAEQGG
ncbi:unnamed protein product, partial [Laminaria digitata]